MIPYICLPIESLSLAWQSLLALATGLVAWFGLSTLGRA